MSYDWIIEALEETWTATVGALRGKPDSDFDLPTACPGWSVKDVLSHIVGFEEFLRGRVVPELISDYPEYVRNDIGRMNEAFVASYRQQSPREILAAFERVTTDSLGALRALSTDEWSRTGWSPEGERPYYRFMETRILDSWIHLQDIRDALLEPADDHGIGEEVVINRFEAAMPYVVGRRVRPPERTLVTWELTGRLARRFGVEMGENKATGIVPQSQSDLVVMTPVALFWRRCAGRIDADAFLNASATVVFGDHELAQAVIEAMNVMI